MKIRGLAAAFAWLLSWTVAASALEIKVLTTADGLPSNRVTALAVAPDGKLWIGTGDAGLYVFDPAAGRGRGYRASDGLSSDAVESVAMFGGKVYVGTASALSVLDGGAWKTIDMIQNVTMRNVRVVASPDGKQLWACSFDISGGTVRFDGKEWRFMGGEGRGLFNNIKGFAFLPEGVLMASWGGAPYLYGGSDILPLREGLPAGNLFASSSLKGKGFVGSSRGLFEFDGKRWIETVLVPDAPGFAVFDLAVRNDVLFAGTVRGLFRREGGKISSLSEKEGLPDTVIKAVAVGPRYIAAGSDRGIALVRGW